MRSALKSAFLGFLYVALCARVADADVAQGNVPLVSGHTESPPPHQAYVSLLGKGGLYALGYQYRWEDWFSVGVATSYMRVDYESLAVVTPYFLTYPYVAGAHALFVDTGPMFYRFHSEAPVALVSDETSYHLGVEISAGYEFTKDWFFVRPYFMVIGSKSTTFYGGIDIGVSFQGLHFR